MPRGDERPSALLQQPSAYFLHPQSPSRLNNHPQHTPAHPLHTPHTPRLLEADLYHPLAQFLRTLHIKTHSVNAQLSSRSVQGSNSWLHPDIVGLENLTHSWRDDVLECALSLGAKRARIWAFELKRSLSKGNVRQAFFQTLANSSWAHFAYLVSAHVKDNALDEIRLLHKRHGVGFILVNLNSPKQSALLVPAKERRDVDWDVCNRIARVNADFNSIVQNIQQFHRNGSFRDDDWPLGRDNNPPFTNPSAKPKTQQNPKTLKKGTTQS